MAKLTRYTQLLFGSTAGSNTMAEFGSLFSVYPAIPARFSGATITPSLVQALSNYLTGWTGAAIGGNSPAIEDMNALCFLFAYQLAYLMQEGISEWDSATTYYIGSLVNNGGATYISLTDTNLNHNPSSDTTNWAQQQVDGSLTPNTMPQNVVVATGKTSTWPNLTIPTATTMTVQTGANLVSVNSIIILGTGTLILQGTASARIL